MAVSTASGKGDECRCDLARMFGNAVAWLGKPISYSSPRRSVRIADPAPEIVTTQQPGRAGRAGSRSASWRLIEAETSPMEPKVSRLDRMVAGHDLAGAPLPATVSTAVVVCTALHHAFSAAGLRIASIATVPLAACFMTYALFCGVRGCWKFIHLCASAHWVRAARAVAGDEMMGHVVGRVAFLHGHQPDYVLTRSEAARLVQAEWLGRREAAKTMREVRLTKLVAKP